MWTSERDRRLMTQEAQAELGLVTLGGDPAAVLLGGERRTLPVYSPGGYCWRPAVGDKVLVLKSGAEREEPCVVGKAQPKENLEAGEIKLSGGGDAQVCVKKDAVELTGPVMVDGQTLEELIRQIVTDILFNN